MTHLDPETLRALYALVAFGVCVLFLLALSLHVALLDIHRTLRNIHRQLRK